MTPPSFKPIEPEALSALRPDDDTRSPLGQALAELVLDAWNGRADEEHLLARLDRILDRAALPAASPALDRTALERAIAEAGFSLFEYLDPLGSARPSPLHEGSLRIAAAYQRLAAESQTDE